MAKLSSFMLGEAIQNAIRPDGKEAGQSLVGLTIVLRPQFIPGNFSFAVSFGISDIDLSKDNTLQLILRDPRGGVVQNLGKTPLPVVSEKDNIPVDYKGFVGGVDFRNAPIMEEGCYKLDILINDESIGMSDIPIYKANSEV